MWNRKELKEKAKKLVKNNYWTVIIVCFILALLTGEFGTSIIGIWQSDDSMDPNYINNTIEFYKGNFNEQINKTQDAIFNAVEANLNSATKSQKYIFKIWDAFKLFYLNETTIAITMCVAAIISLLFTIVIADPLIVAGRKYFLETTKKSNTKIGVIGQIFKKGNWINVAIIMFLKNIYNALWYLTIIGGIIKTYEYRMIPYILAENPKIKRKEAFMLSKQMMRGNKWKTFVLDMSFFGWNFLSVFTFGLLSILYVNPYSTATFTYLYLSLRQKAIEENYEYVEDFIDKKLNYK